MDVQGTDIFGFHVELMFRMSCTTMDNSAAQFRYLIVS